MSSFFSLQEGSVRGYFYFCLIYLYIHLLFILFRIVFTSLCTNFILSDLQASMKENLVEAILFVFDSFLYGMGQVYTLQRRSESVSGVGVSFFKLTPQPWLLYSVASSSSAVYGVFCLIHWNQGIRFTNNCEIFSSFLFEKNHKSWVTCVFIFRKVKPYFL